MQEDSSVSKKQPVIDTRVPLVWFLSVALPILWAAVQLYFTVGQLKETVVDLRATVHVLATDRANMQKEMVIVAYRLSNLERTQGVTIK